MRIVHAVRSDNFAGVERHITVLASAQVEAGHEVFVVGGEPSKMRLHLPDQLGGAYPARTTAAVARRLVQLEFADIFHLHMTAAELAGLAVASFRGSRVVVTRHFASERGSRSWLKPATGVIGRSVKGQIAVSEFVASRVEGDSTVVYAGVPDLHAQNASPRDTEILVAQRLEKEKQTHMALQAFARSGLATAGWSMVVAGRGTELNRLKHATFELGIREKVTFAGFLDDIRLRMGRTGLLLATAPEEPFGLSVVEAMAAALPVVAARGGGHRETVGLAEDAALFEPGNVDEAAGLLRTLAEDEERRQRYGQELRRLQLEWFTPARQYQETMSVYHKVLSR